MDLWVLKILDKFFTHVSYDFVTRPKHMKGGYFDLVNLRIPFVVQGALRLKSSKE